MLVLHDPATLLHSTVELLGAKLIPAQESPERIHAILASLKQSSHELRILHFDELAKGQDNFPSLHSIITQTHSADYVQHLSAVYTDWLKAGLIQPNESVLPECFRFPLPPDRSNESGPPHDIFARPGYYAFDMSTGMMADSYKSIIASANLAYEATKLLHSTSSSTLTPTKPNTIFALTRPPGHHCNGSLAGGYCYINNAAVAVSTSHALSFTPNPKTAILDLDFHHGNGTQHIFYSSPHTLYVSIHGQHEFPYYTGHTDEFGIDEGRGFNYNVPVKPGASFEEYLNCLDMVCTRIRKFDPDFLTISLGFDTFYLDPLGKFDIHTEDYERMAAFVRRNVFAPRVEGGTEGKMKEVNTLILLEGGYVVEKLGENVLSWLKGWEGSTREGAPRVDEATDSD